MKLKSVLATAAIAVFPIFAHASLSDDAITTTYGGFLIGFSGGPPSPFVTTFADVPHDINFTDPFNQNWIATSDFSNGDQLNLSFLTPTNLDGNISSIVDLFTVNYSFATTAIQTVSLLSFTPSTTTHLGDTLQSRLGAITRTGDNSFQLSFNHLITGDTYQFSIIPTPVPEPETYGMMMAGLGLIGFIARRRKELMPV
jgi:hypothetical protein